MAKYCAVPLVDSVNAKARREQIKQLVDQVNTGAYSPLKPHGFLSSPKANSVARFIPVFTHTDTSVYFACLQTVDRLLAASAVPCTFGGWSLGGTRRDLEERQALEMLAAEDSDSIPPSCYNRAAWIQNWNQYWKLLAARHEYASDGAWFATFDLANFYDSVDLRRLETSVRSSTSGFHFEMNVLFHFLRTWNRGLCLYSDSTKGLPMDIVGDCSRLLANFYLTSFDAEFRAEVLDRGGDYMRFADDMVVKGHSESACRDMVYDASERLHKLGLNINVAKVRYFSKDEFNQFWGFAIMDRFESDDPETGLRLLSDFLANAKFGRRTTVVKRAITIVSKATDFPNIKMWKQWVRETALQEDVLLQLSKEQLISFIRLWENPAAGLEQVISVFLKQPFSLPKAILLRALHSLSGNICNGIQDLRSDAVKSVKELKDPVLDLCIA